MAVQGILEEQYSFPLTDYDAIISTLENMGFQQTYFPNNTVLTIYFSDENHRIPNTVYIRARRYTAESYNKVLTIDPESIYNLEIKSKNLSNRKKQKIGISFGDIIRSFANTKAPDGQPIPILTNLLSELDSNKLIPFIATQYIRRHLKKKICELRLILV